MRRFMIVAAALTTLVAIPTAASAQATTTMGAAGGAVAGAAVGGPVGAVIGGAIGGTMGAAAEPRPVYRDDRVWVEPNIGATSRVCWREAGRRICEYR